MTVIAFLFETHSNTVVVVDWFVVGLSTCRNFFALRLIMHGLYVLVDFVDGIRTIELQ